ncbi:uncharacterized protein LOC111613041 [Centruroides sculpturatus]|uniref:uncharacterized protein LOC111613041 n=1 Tax=Centruroides sculpturatus TaxID=218467 RepID=UPI000C6DBEC5|nr:uncharacterized protein LOC111613041 [Centruroides sculpturatus]
MLIIKSMIILIAMIGVTFLIKQYGHSTFDLGVIRMFSTVNYTRDSNISKGSPLAVKDVKGEKRCDCCQSSFITNFVLVLISSICGFHLHRILLGSPPKQENHSKLSEGETKLIEELQQKMQKVEQRLQRLRHQLYQLTEELIRS